MSEKIDYIFNMVPHPTIEGATIPAAALHFLQRDEVNEPEFPFPPDLKIPVESQLDRQSKEVSDLKPADQQ